MPSGNVTVTPKFNASKPIEPIPGQHFKDGNKDCKKDITCPDTAFSDLVLTAWYHDGTHFCIKNGIMNGFSDGTFKPDRNVSRATIVTLLWRWNRAEKISGTVNYNDVSNSEWYYDAIVWADKNGIVNGYGDGRFGPNDDITREQLAAIFARYAKYVGVDTSAANNLRRFTDKDLISDWAIDSIKWTVGSGLVEGKPGNKIDPLGNATRAESAAMMMRYCTQLESK